jgi:hypothetical protein
MGTQLRTRIANLGQIPVLDCIFRSWWITHRRLGLNCHNVFQINTFCITFYHAFCIFLLQKWERFLIKNEKIWKNEKLLKFSQKLGENQVSTRIIRSTGHKIFGTVPLCESKFHDFGSLILGKYCTFVCGTQFRGIKLIKSRGVEVELLISRVRAARAIRGENLRKFTKSRARPPYPFDTIICSRTMVQYWLIVMILNDD